MDKNIYVVTAMNDVSGMQDIVKIQADTAEEAEMIYRTNQTIFAVDIDEWNRVQDAIIEKSDGDFKDFLVKSKSTVNEGKVY